MSAVANSESTAHDPTAAADEGTGPRALWRWLPFVAGLTFCLGALVAADTSFLDLLRYAGYVTWGVMLPGCLVYRVLRGRPYTLIEDLAMGAAVGLTLELAAWTVLAASGQRQFSLFWPLLVVVPFALVPRLRRHWWVRGYRKVPVGWSWALAGIVSFLMLYLWLVFLEPNPVLPPSEGTLQYLDLPYQLSLAAEAKHQFPVQYPQVAGQPLHYHWFGYVHMAMTSLIGGIDLPVVSLRLAVPGLSVLAAVLIAVVGWRVSGRPYVGIGAALLFFVIGEVQFTDPVAAPFGTQVMLVIWHGMSMVYSWVLIIALISPLAAILMRTLGSASSTTVPALRHPYVLMALLVFASSGAKGTSLPVVGVTLALAAVALLITQRRIPWPVVTAGVITGCAQLFAMVVLFRFEPNGLSYGPFAGLALYYREIPGRPEWKQWLVMLVVFAVFLVNMQSRVAGIFPLLTHKRGRLDPTQWLLLFGALAGPALYLIINQSWRGNHYFMRSGFTVAVIASAWGWALALDRARLGRRGKTALAAFAVVLAAVLVALNMLFAEPPPVGRHLQPLKPLIWWCLALAAAAVVGAVLWRLVGRFRPALRGRGGVVLLTATLVAGAPGMIMDMEQARRNPNGGAYFAPPLPASRVEAARWVRDHSSPRDIIATNVHCLVVLPDGRCDARDFWLAAYAERRVVVEGWAFLPRLVSVPHPQFWDKELLALNDSAFAAPTPAALSKLRTEHGVRFLVVDRVVSPESPDLARLATLRFENGRMTVYELR